MSMRGVFFLAGRYLWFNRVKSVILLGCVTITIGLPLGVRLLVARFEAGLLDRAHRTPLVVGARGSRVDLVLHALHFKVAAPGSVPMATAQEIRDTGFAEPIPLHSRYTARGYPVVGTTLSYFDFRQLRVARGTGLTRLGDCVLGADSSRGLGLEPGDRLLTDPENVFDIAGSYPVNLRVAGVLARKGTPDDGAVFVDIKTAWLVQGLAHGHQDVTTSTNDDVVLARRAGNVVANAALPQYLEVTSSNVASFHFHGDPETFPVTAILAVPADRKSETLLRGRFQDPRRAEQMLVPTTVVEELLGLVFRVKRFFDANMAMVAVSTALLLALVILLSLRLRRREMEVLFRLGCSRGLMVRLQLVEWGTLLAASAGLAWMLAKVAASVVPRWLGWP